MALAVVRRGVADDDDGEYDADDVSWSIRSNACFVAGGLIHLWGASWDYAMYHHRDDDAATPDDSVVSPLDQYSCYYVAYQSIWILGPSVYLLNSIIDVRNVLRVARRTREDRSRDDDGRQRECEHDDDRGYDDVDGTTFARSGSASKEWRRRGRRRRPEIIGAGLLPVSSRAHRRKIVRGGTIGLLRPRRAVAALEGAVAAIGRRCRRFARRASAAALGPPPRPGSAGGGGRRGPVASGRRRELGAAAAFGIAASLSVAAALCDLWAESWTAMMSSMTMMPSLDGDYLGENAAFPPPPPPPSEGGWWLPAALEGASVHIYLVSAILALWRCPRPPSSFSLPRCGGGRGLAGRRPPPPAIGCGGGRRDDDDAAAAGSAPAVVAGTEDEDGTADGADGGVADDDDADNRGRTSIPWYSDVGPLETLGDALFGISSVVDVCLQDANVDEIYWWRVASSLLWTVDALLYLRGDFVSFSGGGRRRGGRRGAPP